MHQYVTFKTIKTTLHWHLQKDHFITKQLFSPSLYLTQLVACGCIHLLFFSKLTTDPLANPSTHTYEPSEIKTVCHKHLQPVVELSFWLTIWMHFSQADLNAFFFTNFFILTQKLWTSEQVLAVMGGIYLYIQIFYLSLLPISLQSNLFCLYLALLQFGLQLHSTYSPV